MPGERELVERIVQRFQEVAKTGTRYLVWGWDEEAIQGKREPAGSVRLRRVPVGIESWRHIISRRDLLSLLTHRGLLWWNKGNFTFDQIPDRWMRGFYRPRPLDAEATALTEVLLCSGLAPRPITLYYSQALRPEIIRAALRAAVLSYTPDPKDGSADPIPKAITGVLRDTLVAGIDDKATVVDVLREALNDKLDFTLHSQEYARMESMESRRIALTFLEEYKAKYIDQGQTPPYPLHYFYPFKLIMTDVFQEIVSTTMGEAYDELRATGLIT